MQRGSHIWPKQLLLPVSFLWGTLPVSSFSSLPTSCHERNFQVHLHIPCPAAQANAIHAILHCRPAIFDVTAGLNYWAKTVCRDTTSDVPIASVAVGSNLAGQTGNAVKTIIFPLFASSPRPAAAHPRRLRIAPLSLQGPRSTVRPRCYKHAMEAMSDGQRNSSLESDYLCLPRRCVHGVKSAQRPQDNIKQVLVVDRPQSPLQNPDRPAGPQPLSPQVKKL